MAWSALGCDGGGRDVTIVKATGGSSTGGVADVASSAGSDTGGSGTAPSTGGVLTDNGGSGTGDAGSPNVGASGSTGFAGSAGAAGDSGVRCTSDKQCQALGQLCDLAHQRCVECLSKEQCDEGELCVDHACRSGSPCATDAQCVDAPGGLAVCDGSRGECVQCLEAADCSENHDCVDRRCVAYVPCEDSRDCAAGIQVCNPASGRCVDCNSDADCLDEALPACASDGTCRAACSATDDECSSLGQVCDRMEGYCVQCRHDGDCPASEHCRSAACVPDLCDPGESRCDGNEVAECNDAGNAFGPSVPCGPGQICTALLSHATCTTPGPGQGGAGGEGQGGAAGTGGEEPEAGNPGTGGLEPTGGKGGTAPTGGSGGSGGFGGGGSGGFDEPGGAGGQGGSGGCATGAAPCTSIPHFAGAQNVDGYDDEFCNIPSFLLDFGSHNAKVNTYRTASPSETALVRAAWSPFALHVFVTVTDSSVHAWTSDDHVYEGDSIELFVANTESVTGDPGDDANAKQIQASYERGFVVHVQDAGETSRQLLPETELKGRVFVGGYTIELKVPWIGPPPHSGSTIRVNLVLNSAQNTTEATWRDAQAILTMGPPGERFDGSPCGADIQPYCDDRAWCQTALE
ncbi:MAG: hypothetical protein JW940_06240 [Polyangiaceae bacterium]|nr:hypothetical protein [Polyangiaceae bacterium]